MAPILILHETGGGVYFAAIDLLAETRSVRLTYRESSVARLTLWNLLIGKKSLSFSFRRAFVNLSFRCFGQFFFRGTVIACFAPFDFRIVLYFPLILANRTIFHTSWPHWVGERYPRRCGFFSFALKQIYRVLLRRGEVVAVTEKAGASIGTFLPKENISVIPHVVNSGSSTYRTPNRSNFRPQLLFVGKLVEEKGVRLLIDLAEEAPNFDFVFVGGGPLESLLKRAEANLKNVHFSGPIRDRARLIEMFARSDILLVPSLRTKTWEELFGVVIIEALSVGVPVMASSHCGPQSILAPIDTMYLQPESLWLNCDTFQARVSCIISQKDSHVLQYYAQGYSLENVMEQWSKLLSKRL